MVTEELTGREQPSPLRPGKSDVPVRAAIEMVDDGRGSGSQWPFLWFTAHGGEPMTVRYRMTVTEPAD